MSSDGAKRGYVLFGVNLIALLGLAICGAVMIKKGADKRLLQASFGMSIALLLVLLVHCVATASYKRGGLLLLLLYLVVLYPLVSLAVVLYAKKVSDSAKMRLVTSLKIMLFVSSGFGLALLLYQVHLGTENTREKL